MIARFFALLKTGNNKPAKIPMMAMTTSSSMRVKPFTSRLKVAFNDLSAANFH